MLLTVTLGWLVACAPPTAPATGEATVTQAADEAGATRTRLAIGGFGGLSFGLYPVPSGDVSLFVGAALPARRNRRPGAPPGERMAIGYRGGLSVGEAEFAPGIVTHRHHLAMMGFAGPERRLLVGGGFGVKVVGARGVGIEATTQIGYAALRRANGALVVGGEVRYGGFVCDHCFGGAYPQFGLFAGWLHMPARAPVRPARPAPPRGLGLLIPGALLLGAFGAILVMDIVIFSSSDASECHGCSPLTPYALPLLLPGVPLTAVGAIRSRRYRQWRAHSSFAPRPAGFTVQF